MLTKITWKAKFVRLQLRNKVSAIGVQRKEELRRAKKKWGVEICLRGGLNKNKGLPRQGEKGKSKV